MSINEKPVLKGTMIWLIEHMQSRIDNVILDAEFIKSFNITFGRRGAYWTYGYCSYGVLNELIGRILMQDIHP